MRLQVKVLGQNILSPDHIFTVGVYHKGRPKPRRKGDVFPHELYPKVAGMIHTAVQNDQSGQGILQTRVNDLPVVLGTLLTSKALSMRGTLAVVPVHAAVREKQLHFNQVTPEKH